MGEGNRFAPLRDDDPRTVSGYTLHARLGSGGMGEVYLGFTPGGRPLAIKVVRPDLASDEEFRQRFRNEIRAAQRVQGMYTASVIDSGPDARYPWLATAYVPGPSLQQAVREHGPLPEHAVIRMLAGVAEALAAVHGAGLVHRDLKPANVLLAEDGPRVIDFGIAHALDATSLTRTGVRIGTPAFMAPEQVRGRPVTAATDVFALGHLAVFAATGHPAFGEGPSEPLLFRIATLDPDLDACPAYLRDLASRCLARDPAHRPTTAEVLAWCRERLPATSGTWLPPTLDATLDSYATVCETPLTLFATGVPDTTPPGPRNSTPIVLISLVAAVAILAGAGIAAVLLASRRAPVAPAAQVAVPTSSPPPSVASPEEVSESLVRQNGSGYSVRVPSTWTRRAEGRSIFWDAPDGLTILQIDRSEFDPPYTVRSQAEAADARARRTSRYFGYTLLSIDEVTYGDGIAADWTFTYRYEDIPGEMRATDRFLYLGGKPAAIFLRTPAASWPAMEPVLAEIHASLTTTS